MMVESGFSRLMQCATYELKEGTAGSYYRKEGSNYLPNRLSISRGEISNVARTGRNLQKVVGQLFGRYTKGETSPLKQYPPYEVRTQIWEIEGYPQFIGYGTIGVTGVNKRVCRDTDRGDVVVISRVDGIGWRVLQLYVFPRSLFQLREIFAYLANMRESNKVDK